jgi:hypothetical protein
VVQAGAAELGGCNLHQDLAGADRGHGLADQVELW